MSLDKEFAKPSGLTDKGNRAYDTIMAHLRKSESDDFKLSTGGCRTFYSPKEWAERGEEYGRNAVLIVVYDGGDVRPYFNMDAAYEGDCMLYEASKEFGLDTSNHEPYSTLERMSAALKKVGLYAEECTTWYCAIYEDR